MKVSVDVSLKDTEYWQYKDLALSLPGQNLHCLEERSLELGIVDEKLELEFENLELG